MRLKVIYIAGPYNDARGEYYVGQNIREAERAAIFVWGNGGVALCPHKNTARFGGVLPDTTWLEGDLELLRRCDAIWMIYRWKESPGANNEKRFAEALGLPILYNEGDVLDFLKKSG